MTGTTSYRGELCASQLFYVRINLTISITLAEEMFQEKYTEILHLNKIYDEVYSTAGKNQHPTKMSYHKIFLEI